MNDTLWKTKLAARIHDPAEKALVLYRDPAGHEGGSIVGIGKELGFETHWVPRRDGSQVEKLKLSPNMEIVVESADQWAAAADRPQFPKDANERYPAWARVRFAEEGTLIHPLTGQVFDVPKIGQDVLAEHIKTASEDLFMSLIQKNEDGSPDLRRTLLAFWRLGPELGRELKGIGPLWGLLPADTRTPDHTIWQHLDLTSSLAGAMYGGRRPALLTVSLGPVQEFIAAGRSTSDLWAGSHFLSTMAWQAMKVIAAEFGPDAILFPQLRGVPVVDLWLIEQGVRRELFEQYKCEWNDRNTDYNPLFSAALPNKFLAVVPEAEGERLARDIEIRVRAWVRENARIMLDTVLKEIGETPNGQHCYTQLEAELSGFPDVHWSLAPWLPEAEIKAALGSFYPEGTEPDFFTKVWAKLKEPIEPEAGWKFWVPNDGTLYPAVHDVAERLLAAAKSVRAFEQLPQRGFRDSLSGEYEWLTLDKKELDLPPGQRTNTLWTRVAEKKPSWAKKGEHLSAFGLIKRLWPTHYIEWLKAQDISADVHRFVISTHVMALAPSLEKLMKDGPADEAAFRALASQTIGLDRAALPRRLMRKEARANEEWWRTATRLPTLIDELRERAEGEQEEGQIEVIGKTIEKAIGVPAERYYALILMDGDRLGAWLSGKDGGKDKYTLKFRESFHSSVRSGLDDYRDERLRRYLDLDRPASPARHMAISSALNSFSLDLARHVIEDLCLGKLLYSGGDDVMAMVCVRDLPKALWLLRLAYSGGMPGEAGTALFPYDLDIKRGFVRWGGRLHRVMGEHATASAGAVIAHHMAPLSAVLRSLREAEREAKGKGGRNAFAIRIIKRSGGRLDLTLPWWLGEKDSTISTMHALKSLRDAIADDMSRRAAYHADELVRRFPFLEDVGQLKGLIARNLQYQFQRKLRDGANGNPGDAERIAEVAVREAQRRSGNKVQDGALARAAYEVVQGLLFTAEFLARESRGNEQTAERESRKEAAHA